MAQIFPVTQQLLGNSSYGDTGVDGWLITWENIGNADTPMPVTYPGYGSKSFQAEGTFGGTTVSIQGSNDGVNYHNLTDPTETTISLTSGGLREVLEHTLYLQPALSGGSGSSITATLFVRKTQAQ
jgi:hypothetical protein